MWRSTVYFLARRTARLMSLTSLAVSSAFAATTSYHIGNSLTWGSQPNGLAAMAIAAGKDHAVGYHIHSGWSLSAIWNNPTEITKTNSFGGFATALPNYAWDYVTLQPHHSNTTLASDRQRIIDFINLNEAGPSTTTNYYIYSAWPRQSSGDYKSFWTQSVSSAPNQLTIHAREYFDHLYSAVTNELGNAVQVHMIPVGEVLYRVDLLFESGAVPGFTDVRQLYGDDNHLTGDIGGWIVANTVYATIFKENPSGIKKPEGFYLPSGGGPSVLTDALNAQLQSLVWDVVAHHPATGIDISPNKFTFTDAAGAELNTTQTSNTIQVTGINAATDISITNGMYSVNSGSFTATKSAVRPGDRVSVRLKSAASYSTSVSATLTIGGVSDTFSVTTLNPSANTGFHTPTANLADGGGDGNGYEVGPTAAYVADSLNAVDKNSGTNAKNTCTNLGKDRHIFYNYGFNIPVGSNISGIELKVKAKADSATGSPKVCVQLSWDGGKTWTTTLSKNLGTTLKNYTLGSTASTWGRTWSANDFSNANFRVRIIDVSQSATSDFYLDGLSVRVTYNANPASISGIVFEDLNGDGVWNNTEPPISGARLILRSTGPNGRFEQDGDDVFTSMWTNKAGAYLFMGLSPGSYRVSSIKATNSPVRLDALLTSWVATYNFILTNGENLTTQNFGYMYPQDITNNGN